MKRTFDVTVVIGGPIKTQSDVAAVLEQIAGRLRRDYCDAPGRLMVEGEVVGEHQFHGRPAECPRPAGIVAQ